MYTKLRALHQKNVDRNSSRWVDKMDAPQKKEDFFFKWWHLGVTCIDMIWLRLPRITLCVVSWISCLFIRKISHLEQKSLH